MKRRKLITTLVASAALYPVKTIAGDGVADFTNSAQAAKAGYPDGKTVDQPCQGCNGPSGNVSSGDSGESGSNSSKIVCTAMNSRYGFGSFRQAIWLKHAQQSLTKYHQTGYHILFLPLVNYAYGKQRIGSSVLRNVLEHIARERTADIWAQQRGTDRRLLGRTYRMALEPLMYGVGRLAKGREVAGIAEVSKLTKYNSLKG